MSTGGRFRREDRVEFGADPAETLAEEDPVGGSGLRAAFVAPGGAAGSAAA
jgi:hypothetical protein